MKDKAAEAKNSSKNSNACDDLGGGVASENGAQGASKDGTFIEGVLDSADKRLNSFLNTVTFGNVGTDDVGAFFLMMDKDEDGIYHARFDGWQQFGGYNSFYDVVFDHATSMESQPYEFTYDSQDYRFWAWKGDYLNLGAGAELGLYKKSSVFGNETDHWLVDTSLALPMTLTLKDNKGNLIDSYNPSESQWWITAFNPNRSDVNAEDLRVTYTVDFSGNKGMFDAFYKQLYGKDARLAFDKKNYTTTLNF